MSTSRLSDMTQSNRHGLTIRFCDKLTNQTALSTKQEQVLITVFFIFFSTKNIKILCIL